MVHKRNGTPLVGQKALAALLAAAALFDCALSMRAQEPFPPPASSSADGKSGANKEFYSDRPVSIKQLPADFVQDQKTIWTFPAQVAKGNHWKPVVGFSVITAGLLALDSRDTPYFRRTTSFNEFNKVFSGQNASLGMAIVPAGFFVAGLARRDSYSEHTALLAGEAMADAEVLTVLMKDAGRRLRPSNIPPNGNFNDTWTEARGSPFGQHASFPSGHAIAAFSISTVFARRYRTHRWVPWLAYGLAGAVAFSRIPLQAHFPSDVFAGAALGYFISRGVVLQNR